MLELVDLPKVNSGREQGKKIDLIRRYSGGGTVIVDESTLFASFIMNTTDVPTMPYPRDIMSWTAGIYGPVFHDTADTASFRLHENDYILGELKIGGNAQTITKDRWVHHTSFLWDFAETNMNYLLMPKKRPVYRADRPHGQFLDKLHRHLESPRIFEDRTIEVLHEQFEVTEWSQEHMEALVEDLLVSKEFDRAADVRTRHVNEETGK